CLILFFFYWLVSLRNLPSFPTRRSSDLLSHVSFTALVIGIFFMDNPFYIAIPVVVIASVLIKWLIQITKIHADSAIGIVSSFGLDRKSTRLNSSHVKISYAVFCLKKKKN